MADDRGRDSRGLPEAEDEGVRRMLAVAAEPLPGRPRSGPPGGAFVARARRALRRRRLLLATAVAGGFAAAAVAVPAAMGALSRDGEQAPAASAACVRTVADGIASRSAVGFRAVYGTLREGEIAEDDGITQSSAFRFTIEGALSGNDAVTVPASGSVTVWYPVVQAQLPRPGRYVLLLRPARRPSTSGQRLYEFAPRTVLRLDGRDRVTADCGAVPLERLRAALTADRR